MEGLEPSLIGPKHTYTTPSTLTWSRNNNGTQTQTRNTLTTPTKICNPRQNTGNTIDTPTETNNNGKPLHKLENGHDSDSPQFCADSQQCSAHMKQQDRQAGGESLAMLPTGKWYHERNSGNIQPEPKSTSSRAAPPYTQNTHCVQSVMYCHDSST